MSALNIILVTIFAFFIMSEARGACANGRRAPAHHQANAKNSVPSTATLSASSYSSHVINTQYQQRSQATSIR